MRLSRLIAYAALIASFSSAAQAQSCYESSISTPSPFMGNNDEVFKLLDGSIWQVKYEYQYLYAYNPSVIICPGKGRLIINGKQLHVELLAATSNRSRTGTGATKRSASAPTGRREQVVTAANADDEDNGGRETDTGALIETQIDGDFSGWQGETVFKLANGQIWQQAHYAYTYHYAFRPKVLIFKTASGYQMQVEGIDKTISVTRLN